jgi:phosphohistidine swiveling domain-containing protein
LKTINKKFKERRDKISDNLFKLEKKIDKLQNSHAHLLGKTTYFGVMPDWNPAEIIGFRPNPLALSLYKELITDHIWSKNRKFFGYRDVTSSHLMTTFFGIPYIDLRVDFNSWLPAKLSEKISIKLVNFYLDKFKKNIYLHDKIEFEIIFSSLNFDSKKNLDQLKKNNFNKKEIFEIKKKLTEISNLSFKNIKNLKNSLTELEKRFEKIYNSKMYMIDKIYWLIEDCKMYGTYPFAGFARGGFMAIGFLKSMVDQKIISEKQKELFLNSIQNVASNISHDYSKFDKSKFIKKHGHIRPNTYDINSPNYKDGYNLYFKNSKKLKKDKKNNFNFDKNTISRIKIELEKNRLDINVNEFILFIKESIELREYSKYLFSKNVNAILELVKKFGFRNNISVNDASYLDISDIINLYYSLDGRNLSAMLKNRIKENKKIMKNNLQINLPEVITSKNDIYYFKSLPSKVNYVGQGIVFGKHSFVKNNNHKSLNLNNRLVLIENADPGYDFIFSHKICGLITKFGGANSHMSIRCSELGIQAAIGVGEKIFNSLLKSNKIEIDGKNQTIKSIF